MMTMSMMATIQVEGKPVQAVQLIFCPNWPHLRYLKYQPGQVQKGVLKGPRAALRANIA